jgi:aminobenzoyl-glutamate utilization protein B
MTLLDLMTRPELLSAAWDYFSNVQTKTQKYSPFIRPTDQPHLELNKAIMDRFEPQLEKYYYDSSKYPTYLDQLGIKYPTLRTSPPAAADAETPEPVEMPDVVVAAGGS